MRNKRSVGKVNTAGMFFAMAAAALIPAMPVTALAGEWRQDMAGLRYIEDNGELAAGKVLEIDGETYLFDAGGHMVTNRWEVMPDGKRCYFAENGAMAKNRWIGNSYVGSDGAMLTNAMTPDSYYVGDDGEWIPIEGFFIANGIQVGWEKNAKGWRYKDVSGAYVINHAVEVNGKTYVFDKDGYIAEGRWAECDGKWYYCLTDGAVAKNMWIGGIYYVGKDGVMLTDSRTPDGYYVGKDGKWVEGT